jgi:hypothetical protein
MQGAAVFAKQFHIHTSIMPAKDQRGAARLGESAPVRTQGGRMVGMLHIGRTCDVEFDIEAWDSVSADVELAVCGMFLREMPGAALGGGLRHLDEALGGGLVALRRDGIFKGAEGETLLLTRPPKPIVACAVLLVGFGEPTQWSDTVARRVAATAAREVLRLRAGSVAFAPGLLDSGLQGAATAGPLLDGVIDAIEGTAPGSLALKRWIFDAGSSHVAQAAGTLQAAFAARV